MRRKHYADRIRERDRSAHVCVGFSEHFQAKTLGAPRGQTLESKVQGLGIRG